jgi:hypothetical protein
MAVGMGRWFPYTSRQQEASVSDERTFPPGVADGIEQHIGKGNKPGMIRGFLARVIGTEPSMTGNYETELSKGPGSWDGGRFSNEVG